MSNDAGWKRVLKSRGAPTDDYDKHRAAGHKPAQALYLILKAQNLLSSDEEAEGVPILSQKDLEQIRAN